MASPPKDPRIFRSRAYVLEKAITTDFALLRAAHGDQHGNLAFHRSAANFNPLAAMAGRTTIAEVEEFLETGAIDPDAVHLPGIYVDRVVGPVPSHDSLHDGLPRYLNKDLLLQLWPVLHTLAGRTARAVWEDALPELASRTRAVA
ncbi:acyl CoA:acetate/3-ketoacid CoA transferase [Streptomyces sp. SLBN-8D4]